MRVQLRYKPQEKHQLQSTKYSQGRGVHLLNRAEIITVN